MNELANITGAEPLDDYEPAGVELSPEYWTPEDVGESRRMYFLGIAKQMMPSADDPDELVELDCVMFAQVTAGVTKVVANGSKRLVGVFEDEKVAKGVPVQITYRGKVKNKSNQKQCDDWSVVKLQKKSGGAQ